MKALIPTMGTLLALSSPLYAATDLGNGFFLADNGITITCDSASVGESCRFEYSNRTKSAERLAVARRQLQRYFE